MQKGAASLSASLIHNMLLLYRRCLSVWQLARWQEKDRVDVEALINQLQSLQLI